MFVVDCSVAIKWFLPEMHSAAASRLREERASLHVPELFHLEFGSALLKKMRRNELALDECVYLVGEIRRIPLVRHADRSLLPRAFDVAAETGASIYDCTYLALAVELSGTMVSADVRFLRSIAESDYARYAVWVEDLPSA